MRSHLSFYTFSNVECTQHDRSKLAEHSKHSRVQMWHWYSVQETVERTWSSLLGRCEARFRDAPPVNTSNP